MRRKRDEALCAAQSTVQSTVQSTAQSTAQSTVQSTVQRTVQSTAQSTAQSAAQSTAQSAAQSAVECVQDEAIRRKCLRMRRKEALLKMITIVCAVVMLVNITYSWILDDRFTVTRKLEYNNGTLSIASFDMSATLFYYDFTADEYVEVTDETPFENIDLVPNAMMPFRIRITNHTGQNQTVRIVLRGITSTGEPAGTESILTKMYVGCRGGYGYVNSANTDVVVPEDVFVRMDDASRVTVSGDVAQLELYTTLVLPINEDHADPNSTYIYTEYTELDCFFWFDRNATIEYSGVTFSVEKIIISM